MFSSKWNQTISTGSDNIKLCKIALDQSRFPKEKEVSEPSISSQIKQTINKKLGIFSRKDFQKVIYSNFKNQGIRNDIP